MLVLEFYSPIAKDFMLLEKGTVSWKEQQGPHRGLKMVDWASANDAKVARASTGRGGGEESAWRLTEQKLQREKRD